MGIMFDPNLAQLQTVLESADIFFSMWPELLAVTLLSYFLGCCNGAVIVSKYVIHDDIRTHGSGNAGLTNFYRTFGGWLTLLVIACDVLKAVAAVTIGIFAAGMKGPDYVDFVVVFKYWAAAWCLLGHMFPCMFGFRGGKGILSGGTIALMLDWRLALLVWLCFLLPVLVTRYVSLGSILAAAAFPLGTWLFVSHDAFVVVLAIFLGLLVLWMHRKNIQRLLSGTESRLSLHKKQ